ncbi:MAG TPA: CcmD family protein [Verrucomicrobiae bacterium]|nr:CcmD family protein [Verrucomicrobiae bacterium]
MTALTYGLIAAWAILVAYVLSLANRDRHLRREIDHLKSLIEK